MDLFTSLLIPSGIAYVLYGLGLLARPMSIGKSLSWWMLALSGAVTIVFSSGLVAAGLMGRLEYRWPVVEQRDEQYAAAKHIVVLTAWGADDRNMPLTGRLNASSTYRVLLALELHHTRPDCDIVISGDSVTARLMSEVLQRLGVPAEQILLEEESLSTADSARNIGRFVQREPFFLVTSAGHMPRAVAAAEKQGLDPIPAPTDHQFHRDWRLARGAPHPAALVVSDLAVRELLGSLWYRLTGRA